MRLHKFMALCGVASRRKSEEIILDLRVEVNGVIVSSLQSIDEINDIIKVDGEIIKVDEKKIYIMLNKPLDCVTTSSDQFGRTIVLDFVKDIKERIYPVGRLDYNTTGLILLTNDGDLANKIMHPSNHLPKVYLAKVKGQLTSDEINTFKTGINLEEKLTSPAKIDIINDNAFESLVKVEIYEGRNRQVRKMLDYINHPVITLKRISVGGIELGDLKLASYRHLTSVEVDYLKNY